MFTGNLSIQVTSTLGLIPIKDATIRISNTGTPENTLEVVQTDSSGQSPQLSLDAPDPSYSEAPESSVQPYSEYNLEITAPGYEPVSVSGTQILAGTDAIQPVEMTPVEVETAPEEDIVIPEHTLWGEYPPKIPEDEIKPMNETGEIVLSRVVIPEYIVVHDGVPQDRSAPNYYVKYKDYIKNVVSSEIYATWSENTIYANILVILSFTLNRVYTEWYPHHWIQVIFHPKNYQDES